MLASELKDLVHSNDDVLQVVINVWRTLPLMLHLLLSPGDLGQVGHGVFPVGADSHAFIELQSYIGEGDLPNVGLFEFSFDSSSERFGDDDEHVCHSLLRVFRVHVLVAPDVIESFLNAHDLAGDRTERSLRDICVLDILEVLLHFRKVFANQFS